MTTGKTEEEEEVVERRPGHLSTAQHIGADDGDDLQKTSGMNTRHPDITMPDIMYRCTEYQNDSQGSWWSAA